MDLNFKRLVSRNYFIIPLNKTFLMDKEMSLKNRRENNKIILIEPKTKEITVS